MRRCMPHSASSRILQVARKGAPCKRALRRRKCYRHVPDGWECWFCGQWSLEQKVITSNLSHFVSPSEPDTFMLPVSRVKYFLLPFISRAVFYLTADPSRVVCGFSLRPLARWDCGFETRRGHGCLSLEIVVCCQVEVSASG